MGSKSKQIIMKSPVKYQSGSDTKKIKKEKRDRI